MANASTVTAMIPAPVSTAEVTARRGALPRSVGVNETLDALRPGAAARAEGPGGNARGGHGQQRCGDGFSDQST